MMNSRGKETKPSIALLGADRRSVLSRYEEEVKAIRRTGLDLNLSRKTMDKIILRTLKSLHMHREHARTANELSNKFSHQYVKAIAKYLKAFIRTALVGVLVIIVLYLILQYKPAQYFIQSKLQDFIYPVMKMLRKMSLPLISIYPSLTDWYDESCLLENPYFRVPDMPCPCENVRSVLNLTGENTKKEQYHAGIPYILKIDQPEITWEELQKLYTKHAEVFDHDANRVFVSSSNSAPVLNTPSQVFSFIRDSNKTVSSHTHFVWRSNRMEPSRLFRSLFGWPHGEPSYAGGFTIEKLVIIDGSKVPSYHMPTTDGSTVFMMQSHGDRLVMLNPVSECTQRCSTVSVLLPSSHILWFSWWYWRASSFPAPGDDTMNVAYIGSHL